MPKSLVVVESPSKAKTINKYLGKDYQVLASIGHIKDLPEKGLGVDIEHNFVPTYEIIPDSKKRNNAKIITELKSAAKDATAIYLAADPDREGEAICQHLKEVLTGSRNARKPVYRVLFNEITKDAILAAFQNPGQIDNHKVDAQQARRVLDRLVGYQVSPLLCRRVGGKLSAGRVQSVALRLVSEREAEITNFVTTEYWTIAAELLNQQSAPFTSKLYKVDQKTVKTSDFEVVRKTELHIRTQVEADAIVADARTGPFIVKSITTKDKKRNPVPPFTTSKLQQEAARKLRLPVSRTMSLAQRLYEGVELNNGELVGLITYMRTDSTRISESAISEVRDFIKQNHGDAYLPTRSVAYGNKKGSQDAHEAIRPTSVYRTPEMVAPFLNKDELALYKLIWQRFVACQMAAALFAETIIDIDVRERYIFRTTGLVLKFAGFLSVYVEGKDEKDEDEPESLIPVVTEGEVLTLQKLAAEQSFTRPPARYTEATLVKALEEKGIGRPSTYAQILQVIQNRSYVEKRENRFHPTELGLVVNEVLVGNFDKLFNVSYTAQLEQQLDDIEEGNQAWQKIIEQFYKTFSQDLAAAEENIVKAREGVMTEEVCHRCSTLMMLKLGRFGRYLSCTNKECKATRDPQPKKAAEVETLEAPTCENCGKAMELKRGRWGQFFACTGYPECKTTRKLTPTAAAAAKKPDVPLTELCPDCGNNLAMKSGRYGDFVSCSNYPTCKYIKRETTGIACPTEGCKGQLRVNKSRRGKAFYGCSTYPKCKTVFWDKPLATPCPKCHAPFIFEKVTKRSGTENYCSQCTYRVTVAEPPSEGIIDVPALTPVSADPSPVSADPSLA